MPNHVRNILTFKHLKKVDIDFILDTITKEEEDHYAIDFKKIIPEPESKAECPKDCLVHKDSPIMKDEDRPWFDWYTWHNKYWGTKWNAYDCSSYIGGGVVQLAFSTAWSMPDPIIKRLKLLGFEFDYKWADEDLGINCGKISWSTEQGWSEAWEKDAVKDTVAFARRVWAY